MASPPLVTARNGRHVQPVRTLYAKWQNSVVRVQFWWWHLRHTHCTLSLAYLSKGNYTPGFRLQVKIQKATQWWKCFPLTPSGTDPVDFEALSFIIGFNCTSHLQIQETLMSKCCQLARDANEPWQVEEAHPVFRCAGKETLSCGCSRHTKRCLKDSFTKEPSTLPFSREEDAER